MLSYYECPSDCQAYCCKIQEIEIDMKDLKALCNVLRTITDSLDSTLYNGVTIYKLKYLCPFFSEFDKCNAYKHRPTICRIYPFNFNSENEMFTINPCKMGVNILNDFFEPRTEILNLPLPQNAMCDLDESSEIIKRDMGEGS
nr:YkgJ family cysteine cluster protein [Methanolobus sp.]